MQAKMTMTEEKLHSCRIHTYTAAGHAGSRQLQDTQVTAAVLQGDWSYD